MRLQRNAARRLGKQTTEQQHINNIQDFDNYIDSLCDDVWINYKAQLNDQDDWHDIAHELADGSQYVIYYGMAWDLVTMIRRCDFSLFNDAEDSAFDHGI